MPYQIKNGIIYSGNAVTLTQAQYDALTTAEKNNGTVYYIYDSDAMIEAQEVGLDGGNVETLAGSVATFESSPSTAVHAEGEYILYQAQLYKVTSAIAVGEDLTVGSNIEATNLGNELNAGFTTEEVTLPTANISAHGNIYDQSYNLPSVAGYTPWIVGGFWLQGGGYASCGFARLYIDGNQLKYAIFNDGSSSAQVQPKARIVYKRNH